MPLPGTVQPAAANLMGFDANSIISSSAATDFAQTFQFCLRYVSRTALPNSSDLSTAEALDILNAGLALMPVQHVHPEFWVPTKELGSSYGAFAASHASHIGFPPGVNVCCDLEGVAEGTPAQQVIDYCNAWYDAVAAAGYVPGIYVGANCILGPHALRFSLKFAHYWKSLSTVPVIPGRGYQMVQTRGDILDGVGFDNNATQTDELGGTVFFLSPATGVFPTTSE